MALSVNQIIEANCPKLFNSPLLSVFVQMAMDKTSKSFYGKMYPYAVAYRAWHEFDCSGKGSNAAMGLGQIASMSEGGMSVSFANTGGEASSGLESTPGGRLLLALNKSRPTMGCNTAGL